MTDLGPESAIRLAHAQASEAAMIAAKQASGTPSGNVGEAYVEAYRAVFAAVVSELAKPIPAVP